MNHGSKAAARAAVLMAMSESREEEKEMQTRLWLQGTRCAAVDCGGDFFSSIAKFVERAVVAAKREGVVEENHIMEGAVAGAAHEALMQILSKSAGLSVGGKMAVAREGEHIAVACYFGIGLVHLNDIAMGLGHRAIAALAAGKRE